MILQKKVEIGLDIHVDGFVNFHKFLNMLNYPEIMFRRRQKNDKKQHNGSHYTLA